MKFMVTPDEVADSALQSAIHAAIKDLMNGLRQCGELSAPEAKQSAAAKEYFADQARVYADAIANLQRR